MVLNNFNQILEEYQKTFIQELKDKLKSNNRVASGKLLNSLRTYSEEKDGVITVYLVSEDYLTFVNDGRNPTKNSGDGTVRKKIFDWIVQKNILPRPNDKGKLPTQEQLSYAIVYKIHKEGYTGDKSLDETISHINSIYIPKLEEALKKDLFEYLNFNILSEINNIIQIF